MNFRLFVTNVWSIVLILYSFNTSSVHALQSIKPVAPALAARYMPARTYKGLTEHYRHVLQLVEAHWRIPTSEQTDPDSYSACEQALETFFEEICKNSCTRSLDDYLAQLELDIRVLSNLEQMLETSPQEVRTLKPGMSSLRKALIYIRGIMQYHRFYHHCIQQLIAVQGSFTQEFSLLKNREILTLAAHLRSNATRNYCSDIAMTTERIKVAIALAQPRYPQLTKELVALLKSCEHIKEIYEKI